MGFYDYSVLNRNGEEVKLADFRGKVVVVVNTATGCGFTPHYEPLEQMYQADHEKGLEILDIPCNQFYGQAPGSDEEIHGFCQLHYHTSFDQMKKAEVNGEHELPLYTFLKTKQGFKGFHGEAAPMMDKLLSGIDPNYQNHSDIKWNFTKFIIDRKGEVVARFEPTAPMDEVRSFVESLL